jgi:hypothetical protein
MAVQQLSFDFANVPTNFCASGSTPAAYWQSVVNMLASIISGTVPASSGLYPSANTPPTNLQGQVIWIKLDTYGNPVTPCCTFWFDVALGKWVWPIPTQQDGFLRPWTQSETALWEADGGDVPGVDPSVTPPTAATGAVWMVNHAATDFRMFISAGTNPASYNGQAATVLSVGQTGGEEKHVLTPDEIWHQHPIGYACQDPSTPTDGWNQLGLETGPGGAISATSNAPAWESSTLSKSSPKGGTGTINALPNVLGSPVGIVTDVPTLADANHPNLVTNLTPPAPTAHNTLPPYFVGLWAQRTARQFFRGN